MLRGGCGGVEWEKINRCAGYGVVGSLEACKFAYRSTRGGLDHRRRFLKPVVHAGQPAVIPQTLTEHTADA